MTLCWGIDLGGTKIEGVVAEAERLAEPLCRIRVPTEAALGYERIVSNLGALLEKMNAAVGAKAAALGVCGPGAVQPSTGRMKNCNTTCLNGQLLKADLERTLGLPVDYSNDANCFALAEAKFGAGKGAGSVFGVILGTGVGGGIVVDGKVVNGAQGIGGEWGHNPLDETGPLCYCGKRGCVETLIAGPALEAFYKERSGQARELKEIELRAAAGNDLAAQETIDRFVRLFGKAIAVVINILDPDVVVLGGGASNVKALYSKGADAIRPWIFNDRVVETKIVQHALGDSAGVFGALMLARQVAERTFKR